VIITLCPYVTESTGAGWRAVLRCAVTTCDVHNQLVATLSYGIAYIGCV
jgi:hypothetical protein